MFCDTCHWYTAGKSVCPHCGAVQKPKPARDMFNLPGDVSILDDAFMNKPLVDTPMPAIETSAPKAAPRPAPQRAVVMFCSRCGKRAGAGVFCSACGAPLPQPK